MSQPLLSQSICSKTSWVRSCFQTLMLVIPLFAALSCQGDNARLTPGGTGVLLANDGNSPENPQKNKPLFYDFCSRQGLSSSLNEPGPWSAAMVQKVLTDLIESPDIKQTTWVAYPVTYRRMTAARDKARCEGVLTGARLGLDQEILLGSQLINHHLADIMTRWLVYQMKICSQMPQDKLPPLGICGLMAEQRLRKYDTLSTSMSTSGVYISSHIALSLSAVMADDLFWDEFPDPKTRRKNEPLHTIPAARFMWLDRYKLQFDLFNDFLANHLNTVADALNEAKLLKNQNLSVAAKLSELGICRASMFGSIRDKAFQAARDYLKGTLITQHPMLTSEGGRLTLSYGSYNFKAPLPKSILDAEAFGLSALASPAIRQIYQNLLGGISLESGSTSTLDGCPRL